jgi:hypothetical protein
MDRDVIPNPADCFVIPGPSEAIVGWAPRAPWSSLRVGKIVRVMPRRKCPADDFAHPTQARTLLLNAALPILRQSPAALQNRFIALLKPPFKSSDDYRRVGWEESEPTDAKKPTGQ